LLVIDRVVPEHDQLTVLVAFTEGLLLRAL
jgi:hypothetical protein